MHSCKYDHDGDDDGVGDDDDEYESDDDGDDDDHLHKVPCIGAKRRWGALEALDSLDCVVHRDEKSEHWVFEDRRQGGEAGHVLQVGGGLQGGGHPAQAPPHLLHVHHSLQREGGPDHDEAD